MYKCDSCSIISGPKERRNTVPAGYREAYFPRRRKVNKSWDREYDPPRRIKIDDPGGFGFQITGELKLCAKCVLVHALYGVKRSDVLTDSVRENGA